MPVKALSKIVAAKFRDGLKKQAPELFGEIDSCLWRSPWVVHSQPVGKGQAALKYLATYIFRPAISNGRLLSLENGIVSFRYQGSQTRQWKVCRLEAIEFIRRYLQHVLPRGFVKVRYYGLYGHRHREQLSRLRQSLEQPVGDSSSRSVEPSEPVETSPSQPLVPSHMKLLRPGDARCGYHVVRGPKRHQDTGQLSDYTHKIKPPVLYEP
jgi:hypothetical protein